MSNTVNIKNSDKTEDVKYKVKSPIIYLKMTFNILVYISFHLEIDF